MSEAQNTAVVERAYNCFKTGDMAGLLSTFAQNITWTYPEIADAPFARSRNGRDDVADFFSTLGETCECLQFVPREFTASGDKVIAQGMYEFRVKETGRSYRCDYAHFFTVNGDQITSFMEYTDTAAVAAAFQKSMAA